MIKWKLMLTTLPYVALALVVKLGLELGLKYPGLLEFSDLGPILTGGVFLIGFMLAGTMADYKESERLPGEVACTLETLKELLVQASIGKPAIQVTAMRKVVLEVADQIHDWLFRKVGHPQVFAALTRVDEALQQVERDGGGSYASKGLSELHALRKSVTRMGVISRTGFLASGYALLETLILTIIGLIMASKFKNLLAECVLVSFVTLIYVYMLRLIRDVDDPFEYSPDGRVGAAEIELFPIDEYRARLASRIAESR